MQDTCKNPINRHSEKEENNKQQEIYSDVGNIYEALRASEDRFHSILNQSSNGIIETDAAGKFTLVNKRFAEITGYTEEELYVTRINDITHPDDLSRNEELLHELTTKGASIKIEKRYIRKNGSIAWVRKNMSALRDATGKISAFIAIVTDITKQKQEEEMYRRKEADKYNIPENITDAFFAVNSKWQFTYVNQSTEKMFNRMSGELIGKVLWEEFPSLIGSEVEKVYRKVVKEQIAATITSPSATNGEWYEIQAFPAQDGIVAYFHNVTRRIAAEKALQKSEETLRTLINTIDEAFCIIQLVFDENGKPKDYIFLEYNYVFEEMTGLYGALGKSMRKLAPGMEAFWFDTYGKVALTGEAIRFENKSEELNRWFNVYASV